MIENPPEEAAQGARGEQALLAGGNAAAVAHKKNKKETGRRLIFSSLTLFLLHAGLLAIKIVTM